MTTAIWPVDLERHVLVGWTEVPEPNMVPGTNDRGRRKYTKARKIYQVSLMFTFPEKQIFDEFWTNGILDGTQQFTWTRPDDQVACNFLVVGAARQNQHTEGTGVDAVYRFSLQLKELPVT